MVLSSAGSSDLWPDQAGLRISGSTYAVSVSGSTGSGTGGSGRKSLLRRRIHPNTSHASSRMTAAPPTEPNAIPIFCATSKPEIGDSDEGVADGECAVSEGVEVGAGMEVAGGSGPVEADAGGRRVVRPRSVVLDEGAVEGEEESSECADAYAVTSSHVTESPRFAGNDMILVSREASVKATVLDVDGHQQVEGTETVLPSSSQATHSLEVPLQ